MSSLNSSMTFMPNMKTVRTTNGINIIEELAFSWPSLQHFSSLLFCKCKYSLTFLSRILCWLQTGNLLRGETTCERFAKTNYKVLHQYHKEQLSMELSLELDVKRRFSVMTIDDNTNPNNILCGNVTGMCCDQYTMA